MSNAPTEDEKRRITRALYLAYAELHILNMRSEYVRGIKRAIEVLTDECHKHNDISSSSHVALAVLRKEFRDDE